MHAGKKKFLCSNTALALKMADEPFSTKQTEQQNTAPAERQKGGRAVSLLGGGASEGTLMRGVYLICCCNSNISNLSPESMTPPLTVRELILSNAPLH